MGKLQAFLCAKHHDKLQCVRNYSDSFVKGIEGTAMKKDNILKHQKSEQHTRALRYESEPMSMLDVYSKTPLGKALANSERADRDNVGRLIEIVYMMAKRALPFNNFNSLSSMEKSHGVSLGSAYQNVAGCRDMTQHISECIEGELKEALAETKYFSILMDGSTDCAVVESELMYVIYVDKYGNLTQRFMKLKKVHDATAAGLTELLKDTMAEIIPGLGTTQYIVKFGADGASVNMGVRKGIPVRLQDEYPWF